MKKVFVLLSFCPDVWKLFNKTTNLKQWLFGAKQTFGFPYGKWNF